MIVTHKTVASSDVRAACAGFASVRTASTTHAVLVRGSSPAPHPQETRRARRRALPAVRRKGRTAETILRPAAERADLFALRQVPAPPGVFGLPGAGCCWRELRAGWRANCTWMTALAWPVKHAVPCRRPDVQRRMVLSLPPERAVLPSADRATLNTGPAWPSSSCELLLRLPVPPAHACRRGCRSGFCLPSCDQATLVIGPVCPSRAELLVAVGHVPDAQAAIVAAGHDPFAVRGKGAGSECCRCVPVKTRTSFDVCRGPRAGPTRSLPALSESLPSLEKATAIRLRRLLPAGFETGQLAGRRQRPRCGWCGHRCRWPPACRRAKRRRS